MLRKCWWGTVLLLAAGLAWGSTRDQEWLQRQADMVLTGHIVVAGDGKTASYSLDKVDRIPASVQQLVAKTIAGWSFQLQPGADHSAATRAHMTLRVVAVPTDAEHMQVRVQDASFESEDPLVRGAIVEEPRKVLYPKDAVSERVEATTRILVEIDVHGAVVHADAFQTNLRKYGRAVDMERWRALFANAAVKAVKWMRFRPPQTPECQTGVRCYAVVPIDFQLNIIGSAPDTSDHYGQWDIYIPGPKSLPGWYVADPTEAIPDVSAGGRELATLQPVLTLLNPPGSS